METKKLPKLRPITYKNKKYKYHIKDTAKKRHLAIDEGIKKDGKDTRKNAKAKKARFNVLRIYRRYKKPEECKILTKDMKYIDKKYNLGTTKKIC
jgi:hydroxylamine reductase (hybrid-cluster protein)